MNTTPMNDQELKLKLAVMLPEKIRILVSEKNVIVWNRGELLDCPNILDTEWLDVCHKIEKLLTWHQVELYRDALSMTDQALDSVAPIESCVEHWSWQQRAAALIAVRS